VRRVFVWAPAAALMALIFIASSSPDPGGVPKVVWDKAIHLSIYGALGLLTLRALVDGRIQKITLGHAIAAFVLTTLYGVSDEFHQSFVPGRTPDVMDVVADAVGAAIGIGLLWFVASTGSKARRLRTE
jgi:VanZ family protein